MKKKMKKEENSFPSSNNTVNVNVSGGGSGDGFKLKFISEAINNAKQSIKEISNASYRSIFKVFLVMFLSLIIFGTGYFGFQILKGQSELSHIVSEAITTKKEYIIDQKIRDAVSPKIDHELDKLLYASQADRTCVFEFHNGRENATNMPFRYADMSYERVDGNNTEIKFVSDSFQNLPLTHYPMPYYVAEHTFFIGNVEDLRLIDLRFYQFVKETGGNDVAFAIIRNNGVDIGVLCIFYDNGSTNPLGVDKTREKLIESSKAIAPLLDLNVQKKKILNDEGEIIKDN